MRVFSSKNKIHYGLIIISIAAGAISCSHKKNKDDKEVAAAPAVVRPRVEPSTVNMTTKMESPKPLRVRADIKSFDSPLDQVQIQVFFSPDTDEKLRFFKKPVNVKMDYVAGTTWEAKLSGTELKKLAISGESLKYEARVFAKNDKGQATLSNDSVQFVIQAPPVVEEKG